MCKGLPSNTLTLVSGLKDPEKSGAVAFLPQIWLLSLVSSL